jgi:hypothetical protein
LAAGEEAPSPELIKTILAVKAKEQTPMPGLERLVIPVQANLWMRKTITNNQSDETYDAKVCDSLKLASNEPLGSRSRQNLGLSPRSI